jgi:Carboxypeptidase regulatory-like domain
MSKYLAQFSVFFFVLFASSLAYSQLPSAPEAQTGSISGYVLDTDGAAVPHAKVNAVGGSPSGLYTAMTDDSGFFRIASLQPGMSYKLIVESKGFGVATVTTEPLTAGADFSVTGLTLKPSADESVTAASEKEVAMEVEYEEEHQRVLGVIPNFYMVYSRSDEVPLTTGLKYKLAFRAIIDPITITGAVALAGLDQAFNTPAYGQGAAAFGQRVGASYAGVASDFLIGSAVLPSLLHQDPRYYYQGSGSVKSRFLHALSIPILCKGDNGHTQFNISSIGGDLASGALAEFYTPASNRGVGMFLNSTLAVTGVRLLNSLLQEFVYGNLTTHPKPRH